MESDFPLGCSRGGRGISMFRFPKDHNSCKAWIEFCKRQDLLNKLDSLYKNYRLCELHFEENCISKGIKRKQLLPDVMPTIFPFDRKRKILTSTENTEESPQMVGILQGPSVSCRTSAIGEQFTSSYRTQRKNLQAMIQNVQKEKTTKKFKISDKEKQVALKGFLEKPIKLGAAPKDKKPASRKYSKDIQQFALGLYFLSPKAYSYISRLLTLPRKRSLKRITRKN